MFDFSNFFTKERIEMSLNIILVAALAATFIGVFFFTYAKNVERDIVVNNVDYLVDDLLSGSEFLPEAALDMIRNKLNDIKLQNMTKEDEEVAHKNSSLLKLAFTVLGVLIVVAIGAVYFIATSNGFSSQEIIEIYVKGFIILICVGFVEFLFLKFIAREYISTDPNIVKYNVVNKLKKLQESYLTEPEVQEASNTLSQAKDIKSQNDLIKQFQLKSPELMNIIDNNVSYLLSKN